MNKLVPIACVFYASLYQVSPVGLPGAPANLDAEHARVLQETAWAAVKGRLAVPVGRPTSDY